MRLLPVAVFLAAFVVLGCDDDPPRSALQPTASPSPSPTTAPLGKRRFEINPVSSPVLLATGPNAAVRLGSFLGQSDGQSETGFIELEAGAPDPQTGIAPISLSDSSEYLYASVSAVSIVFCVKLETPAQNAGAIDCNGGSDFSVHLQIDHHVGEIGVDGFTAGDCAASGGTIEDAGRICEAGIEFGDCRADADCDTAPGSANGRCGLTDSTCVAPPRKVGDACRNDSDCDRRVDATNGRCGPNLTHPGVCNGPLSVASGSGDSGPGSVTFAERSDLGLNGLRGRFSIEEKLPCGDEGPGTPMTFALTSAVARGTIEDFSNLEGQTMDFTMPQATRETPADRELQNFSCQDWTNAAGPGCVGLIVPTLHLNPNNDGDIIPAFKFCGR